MRNKPKISVIVTTYNSGNVLGQCLKSIKNQTFKDFELIVVDENSKDSTAKIAKKSADLFIVEGKERCQKRNIGASNSRAEYLLFLDSDMELSPTILEEINKKLNPSTSIIIPEISFGQGFWAKCKFFERSMYVGAHDVAKAPRLYPKKIFEKASGFDEAVIGIEDLDLYNRIRKQNKNLKIEEINSPIYHNEGKLRYLQIVKRMSYYSKSFREYKRRHPEEFKKQISPLRYLKYWKNFLRHPFLAFGFFLTRGSEAAVIFYSILKKD
ncbi:glycosyltransferase family 2 protein [Candidatus Pacearchaeota archaeon]|nr:hypothetical protein [uncultured archaeon]AQS28799.1 hypothetical protein [uncultured archaeon]MBS3076678.1 glycosyltransferase family 2 protein [Candidatus Pacearchaeota archaeon]